MGTLTEKLRYMNETKEAIYKAIVQKQVEMPPSIPFRNYADKILTIKGEDINQNEDIFITDDMQFCIDLLSKPERLQSVGALLYFSYADSITTAYFTIGGYNHYKVETADGMIYQSDDTKNTTQIEHRWDISKTPKSKEGKGNILWAIIYTDGPKIEMLLNYYQFVYLKNTKISFRNLSCTTCPKIVFSCADENACYLIENGADAGSYQTNSVRAIKYLSITNVEFNQYAKKTDKEYLKYLYLKKFSVTGEYAFLLPDFIEHLALLDEAPKPAMGSLLKTRTCKSLVVPSFGTLTNLSSLFSNWRNLKDVQLNCTGINNMTSAFEGCYALERAALESTENVTEMSGMFKSCYALKEMTGLVTQNAVSMAGLFQGCHSLETIPDLNTRKATSLDNLFNGCWSLTEVPSIDTSGISAEAESSIEYLFAYCRSLQKVPLFTIPGKSLKGVFAGCSSLKEVPLYDTHLVEDMMSLFRDCTALESIPQFDTSHLKTVDYLFSGCVSLKEVPFLNTQNVTSMNRVFEDCHSLATVPLFDTSNVSELYSTFRNCKTLESLPLFDFSKITTMIGVFNGCTQLKEIPAFDVNQVKSFANAFDGCISLESIEMKNIGGNLDISASTKFTADALVTVFNHLKTVTTSKTLTVGAANLAKLTDEQKAIATGKGWTLA